jgi:hypothetical protein
VDPGQFVRGLLLLTMRLEGHFISEKMYRIRKRIDLADFYNAYLVVQNNPDAFLHIRPGNIRKQWVCRSKDKSQIFDGETTVRRYFILWVALLQA